MIKTGIYRIRNIVTNIYEDCYVGSVASKVGFEGRWYKHRYDIGRQKHHSIIFQRAWNKYKEDAFEFEVIEYVVRLDKMTDEEWKTFILQREQYYLDIIKPRYNVCKIAGNKFGVKHSEKTKSIMSLRMMGENNPMYGRCGPDNYMHGKCGKEHHSYGSKRSQATKSKMSEAAKGRRVQSFGFKGKHHTDASKLKLSIVKRGEKNWSAKLTERDVRIIKRALKIGIQMKKIAIRFNVAPCTISNIKAGKKWGWM